MDRDSSKVKERVESIRAAASEGKLTGHAVTANATEEDAKVKSAWGPAMRV